MYRDLMYSESSLTVNDTLKLIKGCLIIELWKDGLQESLDSGKCTTDEIYAATREGVGILERNYRNYAADGGIYGKMADQFARLSEDMGKGQEVVIRGRVRLSPDEYRLL